MTYESLMIANQTITKIEVKGKEYAEVNQRIRVFRMLYPNGSIETNIESLEKGICVMSAVVKDDFGSVLGVGHAYEKEDSSFINKTSYMDLSDSLIRINIFYSSETSKRKMGRRTKKMRHWLRFRTFSMHRMIHLERILCILSTEQKDPSEHQHGLIPSSSL